MENIKMNKKVKSAWIAKLRSGKYKKTTGVLREVVQGEHCYCAMGLLALTYEEKTGRKLWLRPDSAVRDQKEEKELIKWAGFRENTNIVFGPFVNTNRGRSDIAGLNDRGDSFLEIANIVEKEL